MFFKTRNVDCTCLIFILNLGIHGFSTTGKLLQVILLFFILRYLNFFYIWLIYHRYRNLYLKTMASHSFSTNYLVQNNFSEVVFKTVSCSGCVQNSLLFRLCSKQSLCSGCLRNNHCDQILFKTITVFRLCSNQFLWSGCI